MYPNVTCALHHRNPWELLVATILFAQCTDKRVNEVTPGLFAKYPTPRDFAAVRQEVLANDIRSTGFFNKTANVVLGTAYGIASGVVVDTHVSRIAARLDLTKNTDPVKIEQDLVKIIPKERWILFAHQVILHGRALCMARNPECGKCELNSLCYAKDKRA